MVSQQLLDYIKEQLEQGVSKEEIKSKLLAVGWQEKDVNEAFSLLFGPSPVPRSPEGQEKTPPSFYYPETPSVQKSKIGLIKIIIGVFVIILAGGGVTLAARIWDPLWNPFRISPEKVIEKMVKKMADVKTQHNDIHFEVDVKNEVGFSVKANSQLDTDIIDPKNPKSSVALNGSLIMEGMEFSLDIETIAIGEVSYIKLKTIPLVFQLPLSIMGIQPEQLKNQWIKFDKESLEQLLGSEKFEEYKKSQEEEKKEQEIMVEKFKKIIENKNFYIIKKEMPDEKIGNKKVYHYLVALNNEEVKKIIPELFETMGETLGEDSFSAFSESRLKIKELDEFFEKIGEISTELWIGKKDNLLYRLKGEKTYDLSQLEESEKGTITIKLDMNLSNFNQPVKIEAPKEYKTIEEIWKPEESIFPSLPGRSEEPTLPSEKPFMPKKTF